MLYCNDGTEKELFSPIWFANEINLNWYFDQLKFPSGKLEPEEGECTYEILPYSFRLLQDYTPCVAKLIGQKSI